jgi:putative phosphoesterase
MTRILLLSDIHGNFPALQAVADQAGSEHFDYIVNCGDCTVYAPFANQVMEWLHNSNAVSIRGNTDDKVIRLLKGKNFKKPGKAEKRIMYTHTAENLTQANRTRLLKLKKKEKNQDGWHNNRSLSRQPCPTH